MTFDISDYATQGYPSAHIAYTNITTTLGVAVNNGDFLTDIQTVGTGAYPDYTNNYLLDVTIGGKYVLHDCIHG